MIGGGGGGLKKGGNGGSWQILAFRLEFEFEK